MGRRTLWSLHWNWVPRYTYHSFRSHLSRNTTSPAPPGFESPHSSENSRCPCDKRLVLVNELRVFVNCSYFLGLLNFRVLNLLRSSDVECLHLAPSIIDQDGLNLAGQDILHGMTLFLSVASHESPLFTPMHSFR